ncbi:MAG: ABC transporter permease [Pseudomonadota bacterium]
MSEAAHPELDATEPAETVRAPKKGMFGRPRREPLIPDAGAAGAPLTAVIAVMSFLAVLSIAAVLVINKAAGDWMTTLRSEVTIQVKGADRDDIETGVAEALRVLDGAAGVLSAKRMAPDDAAALLDPWLGEGNAQAFLNVPAIIEVKIAPDAEEELALLRTRLAAAAPNAALDNHAGWHRRLERAARSGQTLAFSILALIMSAACAISIFAARAGLAANYEVVSLLHLVGATDQFIASEVQRRFFVLGLRGALGGLVVAGLAIGGAIMAARAGVAADGFLPQFEINTPMAIWLLAAPAATCLVTALTARLTVLQALKSQY